MLSVVCTLFEGDYHYGVAALINSLHANQFLGSVYVGYRGLVPPWAATATDNIELKWPGASTLMIDPELKIHFLPLSTDYHLTNYKPNFILRLWEGPVSNSESIFYFDPDITIATQWSFFENWATCGIALCEDINSPLGIFHPRRIEWRRFFGKESISLQFKEQVYANGGFIGVAKENLDFLITWQLLQEIMAPLIGGLNRSSLAGDPLPESLQGPFAPFGKTDQDALNAAVEAWEGPVSFLGKEGMGFRAGAVAMAHALGQPKPWKTNYLTQALKGRSPVAADRQYWRYACGILNLYGKTYLKFKSCEISLSAFICRFYSRN